MKYIIPIAVLILAAIAFNRNSDVKVLKENVSSVLIENKDTFISPQITEDNIAEKPSSTKHHPSPQAIVDIYDINSLYLIARDETTIDENAFNQWVENIRQKIILDPSYIYIVLDLYTSETDESISELLLHILSTTETPEIVTAIYSLTQSQSKESVLAGINISSTQLLGDQERLSFIKNIDQNWKGDREISSALISSIPIKFSNEESSIEYQSLLNSMIAEGANDIQLHAMARLAAIAATPEEIRSILSRISDSDTNTSNNAKQALLHIENENLILKLHEMGINTEELIFSADN